MPQDNVDRLALVDWNGADIDGVYDGWYMRGGAEGAESGGLGWLMAAAT